MLDFLGNTAFPMQKKAPSLFRVVLISKKTVPGVITSDIEDAYPNIHFPQMVDIQFPPTSSNYFYIVDKIVIRNKLKSNHFIPHRV
jgi:hypothetical protein